MLRSRYTPKQLRSWGRVGGGVVVVLKPRSGERRIGGVCVGVGDSTPAAAPRHGADAGLRPHSVGGAPSRPDMDARRAGRRSGDASVVAAFVASAAAPAARGEGCIFASASFVFWEVEGVPHIDVQRARPLWVDQRLVDIAGNDENDRSDIFIQIFAPPPPRLTFVKPSFTLPSPPAPPCPPCPPGGTRTPARSGTTCTPSPARRR